MARPRIYDEPRIATAIRLPEPLHTRLTEQAKARQVSANLLVEKALEMYLDQLPALP